MYTGIYFPFYDTTLTIFSLFNTRVLIYSQKNRQRPSERNRRNPAHDWEKGDKMKKCLHIRLIFVVFVFLLFPGNILAESPAKFLQLSLFPPVQIQKQETSIHGLRIDLIYGYNQDFKGLDIGLVNRLNGDMKGLEIGVANFVRGNATGVQAGFYNQAQDFKGFQLGALNTSQKTKGFQLGIMNSATSMEGLQLGLLYNSTDTLRGIQIGLFNFIWNRTPIYFFPIVNAAF